MPAGFFLSSSIISCALSQLRECGTKHALGRKAGQAVHSQRSQVITVQRQLPEVQGSQCPLSGLGQLVFVGLLRKSSLPLLTGGGEKVCGGLLVDPMGITLIWCLALVLIKWIASKVGRACLLFGL